MRLYQALSSVMIGGLLAACATQLDEGGVPSDLDSGGSDSGGATNTAGSGGSLGKGGSSGGSMAFGGSAGVGGKGGASGSSGGGGSAGNGSAGDGNAGNAGTAGGGTAGEGGSGDASGGAPAGTSCAGLPVWMPNAEPPNKPMLQGDELTYMDHKFVVEPEGAMISWWNDVCPPSGTRAAWCETDAQRYTDLGACE